MLENHQGFFEQNLSICNSVATPSIPEIIWVQNVRAIVVCGFLIELIEKYNMYPTNLKKIVGAVWELPAK